MVKYTVLEIIRSLNVSQNAENLQREMLSDILRYFPRVSIYLQNIHGLMGLSDLDGLYIILTKNRWP